MKPLLTAATITALCAFIISLILLGMRHRKGAGRAGILAFAISLLILSSAEMVLSQTSGEHTNTILEIIITVAFSYLPAFALLIALGLITQNKYATWRNLFVLSTVPIMILVIFTASSWYWPLTPGLTGWEFLESTTPDISRIMIPVYAVALLLSSLVLFITRLSRKGKALKNKPLLSIEIAISATLILILISMGKHPLLLNATSLMTSGYALIGIALIFSADMIPQASLITRDELFLGMSDGIIVINNDDVILDMNPAAEQLIGIPANLARGNPVEMILGNWKNISGSADAKDIEFKGSISLNQQWRYISVRINKLVDGRGRIIILRDITDRRDTNEARQHAREEMFNLLRSFFKSANTSQSSNDFFRDVLFQVAYTFRADSGAICLVDNPEDAKKTKYSLMANQGTLVKDNEGLAIFFGALEPLGWSQTIQEPLIIRKAGQHEQINALIQSENEICIAVLPLLYDGFLMGVLLLVRPDITGFHSDEIVRLSVVTEELASFVYSDRRRKADIALAERHRLSQDLHDSITQKLVGLLQLTEAVKLGLESGAPVDEKRIDRISESARQALREMRLFLYELAPVNIERDGLITILQSRLASVEGRANIQARMFADSEILLSTQEETEIYYIVEEALNNILKHANANAVTIKLKKRKASIYVEIVDNGCGFEPDKVKYGGKGLNNIRERAKRINGKLKINSSPESGTKITMVVPQ